VNDNNIADMLITAAYDSGFCAEVSDVKCLVAKCPGDWSTAT